MTLSFLIELGQRYLIAASVMDKNCKMLTFDDAAGAGATSFGFGARAVGTLEMPAWGFKVARAMKTMHKLFSKVIHLRLN